MCVYKFGCAYVCVCVCEGVQVCVRGCVCVCEWMCSWVGWSAALPVSHSFLYSLKNKNKQIIRMIVNQQLLSDDRDEDSWLQVIHASC